MRHRSHQFGDNPNKTRNLPKAVWRFFFPAAEAHPAMSPYYDVSGADITHLAAVTVLRRRRPPFYVGYAWVRVGPYLLNEAIRITADNRSDLIKALRILALGVPPEGAPEVRQLPPDELIGALERERAR